MVWCYVTRMAVGYPLVGRGKVVFYNAAEKDTCLVTMGRPFYAVMIEGRRELVSAEHIFPGRSGKRDAFEQLAEDHDASAAYHERAAKEMRHRAATIRKRLINI
jgi:hypothetical protein